jgi:hypothetical protein
MRAWMKSFNIPFVVKFENAGKTPAPNIFRVIEFVAPVEYEALSLPRHWL